MTHKICRFSIFTLILFLISCGKKEDVAIQRLGTQEVLAALKNAGATNIKQQERETESMRSNAFREAYDFEISEVSPKGGQVIFFDDPSHGESMFAYYDALKAIAGPYLYITADNTILLQMNSGLKPETAKKFAKILE